MMLLCFTLAEARYAIGMDHVREVVPRLLLTPLPGVTAPIVGAFSYRGVPVPVIDLRARLGQPTRRPERDDHFLIVQTARRTVALVVDRVEGMRSGSIEEMVAAPFPSPSIAGIVPLPDGLLLVYDLDAALSLEEERAIEAGMQALDAPA
ncbi:Positive regulator of CheA protein activity [Minicystis rosea]|nr:Positive regulator of CheA protein activity [Minicystis rosea]